MEDPPNADRERVVVVITARQRGDQTELLEFAELTDFIDAPVKTYSSGMRARLAFALSLAIEFDCYLIDEVIMVGDQNFLRYHWQFLWESDRIF